MLSPVFLFSNTKVMCRASSKLQRMLHDSPAGQLPVLHGRYRTWEEVGVQCTRRFYLCMLAGMCGEAYPHINDQSLEVWR